MALSGVLMALLRRQTTGLGDYIDVAMHHAALAALPNVMGAAMSGRPQPNPKHERSTGGSAFYQIYETSDGRHLVLGAQEIKFVKNLLGRLGRADLVPLCERGPGPHQAPVIDFLRGVFREKPLAHWRSWFDGLDVSFAPVNTLREALDDANVRARALTVKDERGPRAHRARHALPARAGRAQLARARARRAQRRSRIQSLHHLTSGGMRSTKQIAPDRTRADIGRTYDDFVVGDIYEHRPGRTITEADNVWFTLLTMNQHPLHFDAAYAAETEFKKPLVNSASRSPSSPA